MYQNINIIKVLYQIRSEHALDVFVKYNSSFYKPLKKHEINSKSLNRN